MSRDAILSKIRTVLVASGEDSRRRHAVAERIAAHARHLTPARALKSGPELREQLASYLTGQSATVSAASDLSAVPGAIVSYLRSCNLPARVRVGADPILRKLPWQSANELQILDGPAEPHDEIGLSRAVAGVAETGTLVLASGPANPTTLAFLPETHIIVLPENAVVGAYEDAFDIVRANFGPRTMPRTLNLISGPSRTADIGGKIVVGAHGPRRLCVILVGGA